MASFQVVLDTSFFVLHYFSNEANVQAKTREVLRRCRKLGGRGVLPTIVLAEFYAQAAKRVGRGEAEIRFREMVNSGLDIQPLDAVVSQTAGLLRHRYQEKIPWGDCIIAATALTEKVNLVLSEDPHFKRITEIRAKALDELTL